MHQDHIQRDVQLTELLSGFGGEIPVTTVTDITTHSGNVVSGGLFLACDGLGHHGLDFLDEVLRAKPAAIVWEPVPGAAVPQIPDSVVSLPMAGLSELVGTIADRFFASPSAQLRVTGVTGTNGKTTTAWLVSQALINLGVKAGYMGTLGFGIGSEIQPSALTTPGCIVVHRRLRQLADAGAEAVTMEVSSHALDQGRTDGVRIRAAAFTNLSRDHLDYHGSMQAYQAAKARLFDAEDLEAAVINVGDQFGRELADRHAGRISLITVALHDSAAAKPDAALLAELLNSNSDGLRIRFSGKFGQAEFISPLWGQFNVENLLVSAGILLTHGYSLDEIANALATCESPPGRMQRVAKGADTPLVVVDFAHTPDALEKALQAVRAHCTGAVKVVFGCGGNRDAGKRSEMGAIATSFADVVFVTSDNPRHEDPQIIINDVLKGALAGVAPQVIPDRAIAIRQAIATSVPGDAVLIAGKGSENYQIIGARSERFSDADEAAAALGVHL